ncbi:MAG TPA: sigma factor, partial [Chthonomonadaceae bacterium]|nr:sigma factor [Chthonomonadaceae bacterium]
MFLHEHGTVLARYGGNATDRERLYAEFAPLVRRLVRQYGQDAEMRQDLVGEIYYRFCALLDAYDPTRGVPLRPYLVRQLTAATYTYARQQWRIRRRETGWESGEGKVEP